MFNDEFSEWRMEQAGKALKANPQAPYALNIDFDSDPKRVFVAVATHGLEPLEIVVERDNYAALFLIEVLRLSLDPNQNPVDSESVH